MKKRQTGIEEKIITMYYGGDLYQFPKQIAEKYRIKNDSINADELFSDINKKQSKSGALLRGLRVRENLTQSELAEKIKVTQSDISQMENGTRNIGRMIAKRIEKLFDIDYHAFLE
jgi:DNA-binding XRE family transcriptional regulator